MPRIAKADVTNALKLAAKSIIDAGGADGRTSRAELTAALKSLPKEQRALTDIFFKFVDNRDFKAGAQVTSKDVTRAVDYAKTHMVAKYDLNNDGLSKDEVAKMSLTGKRAVDLAKALKAAASPEGSTLGAAALGKAIGKYADKAVYLSEGDSTAQFISASFPAGKAITGEAVMGAFAKDLSALFGADYGDGADFTFELSSSAATLRGLKNLGTSAREADESERESARAFAAIGGLMTDNLTDLRAVRVGPRDSDGTLGVDAGLYAELIVGRTADGKLAGFVYTSVET